MTELTEKTIQSIAEEVKAACIQAAIEGYQNAAISGLCHEGACEASVSAIRMVNLDALLKEFAESKPDQA